MPLSTKIQQFIAQFGNTWNLSVNSSCEEFFESQHASLSESPSIKYQKAIQYGSHDQNRLDIYWQDQGPPSQATTYSPVIVYFHGGGFRAGDNDISPHIHANIAKYFASNNTISILATYRLLPSAQYPSGIEDVTSALSWIKSHISEYGGSPENIFVLGQSAGGAHVAMALFSGALARSDAMPRGIMLQSVPLWYDLEQERRRANMEAYYGSVDRGQILSQSSLGLFRERARRGEQETTELFITVGELDAEEIVKGNLMFLESFLAEMKRLPRFEVLRGHNHISYALAMGLEGDEVGPRILEWVRSLQK